MKKPACVLCYWGQCEAGGTDRPQSLCLYQCESSIIICGKSTHAGEQRACLA